MPPWTRASGASAIKTATQKKPAKRESHYAVMKRLGLIGCLDGPADLAQNRRKYLRQAVRAKHPR